MNEILVFILTFMAGLVLGTIFFGGLWITVQRAVISKMPALWFAGGLISRLAITLIGFYLVCQNNWQRFIICLFGFIAARFIVLWYTKGIEEKRNQIKKEAVNET
jgi:F1F0 ATPase subunit 2